MPKHIKTVNGVITSLLKPKRKPGGPGKPFQLGFDPRRRPGAVRFTKWRQRLSQLSADMLGQAASDEECTFFGMPQGSTHGEILVRCLFVFAAHGDTAAARLLFDMSEKAKLRPEPSLNADVFSKAKAEILEAMKQ
jgi:hypothetical protein